MRARLEAQLIDGACVRMPTDLDYTDPYYLLQFWEQQSDGEQDYYSQWTEVVRGASDVLEVVELAKRKAAEEAGKTTFAVYAIAPDECGECKRVDLIRPVGHVPDGPIEVVGTFGWTMHMDPDDPALADLDIPHPSDPREARLLRAETAQGG